MPRMHCYRIAKREEYPTVTFLRAVAMGNINQDYYNCNKPHREACSESDWNVARKTNKQTKQF